MIRLLLVLLLAGCAGLPPRVYTNGPVTVVLGDDAGIRELCSRVLQRGALGCYWRRGSQVTIACPWDDGHCLVHELRHVVEPDWRHE